MKDKEISVEVKCALVYVRKLRDGKNWPRRIIKPPKSTGATRGYRQNPLNSEPNSQDQAIY